MFIGFGLFSNLYDNEGVIYNLVQGAFIALFVGTVMYLIRLVALRRRRETVIIEN
jgi:inner membrane protein involved in colicin E2 resistance